MCAVTCRPDVDWPGRGNTAGAAGGVAGDALAGQTAPASDRDVL